MSTERKISMGKTSRGGLPHYASSDSLRAKHLTHTVSHSIERKFHRTVSWIGEHLGAKKSKPKDHKHSESVPGKGHGQTRHVRNTFEILNKYYCDEIFLCEQMFHLKQLW